MRATYDTRPRKFVFALMPFSHAFEDIYNFGIKPACESAGAYCTRIDEQIFSETYFSQLYNQIQKADLIIADMTGRHPDVFHMIGYAHALNKRVILLTQTAEDIPFDLKHYPHIVYGRIALLKEGLQRLVQGDLDQPEQVTLSDDPAAGYLQASRPSSSGQATKIFVSYSHKDAAWLERFLTALSPLVRR
jgi:hypothetical protein